MSAPNILNVIVCDFVSQEVTGKFTCVGIYPSASIGVSILPSSVALSFYMEVVGRASGQMIGSYQLRYLGNTQPLAADTFSFVSATDVRMPLYTKPINFMAAATGTYVLEWFFDGRWSEITRFQIAKL
jgi:hypothetical protein